MSKDENSDAVKQTGIFNDSYPPIMDGVALAAQNYAYWLHKKNQPVCVVTVKTPKYADNAEFPIYRYASLPLLIRKPFRIGFPFMDIPVLKKIENIPFRLIHAHCPFSSGSLALHIARQQKIPVIATFHSKYKNDFERAVNNRQLVNWMVKKVIDFYEQVDEVWIPQAAVEETIREYGYKGKVVTVDNGTDFALNGNICEQKRHARAHLNISGDMPVFLFIGQHIWEKNTRLIIDALSLLKAESFKMFFIGTGYAAQELRELAVKKGLKDKVSFLGVIFDRELLKSYYAAADLFLFPSLYDNAPLVVREAAAMHTSSVLLKGSTAAEIITDNYNGFLCDNSDSAFAERIGKLIKTPEIIKQAGLCASQTIARSWENVIDEVMDRYSQLIKQYAIRQR